MPKRRVPLNPIALVSCGLKDGWVVKLLISLRCRSTAASLVEFVNETQIVRITLYKFFIFYIINKIFKPINQEC